MRLRHPILTSLAAGLLAAGLLAATGCGTTPTNTRAMEEGFFGMGYANQAHNYGAYLASVGRFREAHAAFLDAERTAYTSKLRSNSRVRRIYLEGVIAAYERDQTPPQPPIMRETVEKSPQQKALEEGRTLEGAPEPAPAVYPLGMTPDTGSPAPGPQAKTVEPAPAVMPLPKMAYPLMPRGDGSLAPNTLAPMELPAGGSNIGPSETPLDAGTSPSYHQ